MPLVTLGVFGAPHRLAIQPHRHQPCRIIPLCGSVLASRLSEQAAHQPLAHRGIEHLRISVGDHPPDRRLRRRPCRARAGPHIQIRQHRRRNIPDPARDRRIALHSRHDRCRGQVGTAATG